MPIPGGGGDRSYRGWDGHSASAHSHPPLTFEDGATLPYGDGSGRSVLTQAQLHEEEGEPGEEEHDEIRDEEGSWEEENKTGDQEPNISLAHSSQSDHGFHFKRRL